MSLRAPVLLALTVVSLAVAASAWAAESAPPAKVDAAAYQNAVDRAAAFLKKAQRDDGSFNAQAGPGVTAIVVTGLLRNGLGPDDPTVARGLQFIEKSVKPDGGIYQAGGMFQNYETSLATVCLSEANRGGRYDKILKAAEAFLKAEQWTEAKSIDKSNLAYGGAGYGKHARPDLSNTQFFIEALRACGDGPNDPAIQKALVFVSNCQNFENEHNTAPYAAKNPDGGFYYTAASGGVSQADKLPNGALRSYGSMTYAGLKSMIYAGVGPDDPRVKAAFEWAQKHYGLDSNPGMGKAGLYYYYHTFAKALDAMKLDVVADSTGVKHNWRSDLGAELSRRQKSDGSWINDEPRWLEGDPSLVTGYALLCLGYCRPASK